MFQAFDFLRDFSFVNIVIRMLAAMICGGVIGYERAMKFRPAGFRTHILICVGAAMTPIVGQYLWQYMGYYTDITRLSAQVISGVGFIGAGAIIVRGQNHVTGLTTAAGLWTSAIVGIACGLGYIEGAFVITVLILFAQTGFARLEQRFMAKSRTISIYVEYKNTGSIDEIVECMKRFHVMVMDMQITHMTDPADQMCGMFTLRMRSHMDYKLIVREIMYVDSVVSAEVI